MKFILRVFSFLLCLPVTLFFFAVGTFALIEGVYSLNLPMLPWTGAALTYWIFFLGLIGILSMLLALRKKMRLLFALYAVMIFCLSVYEVFLSGIRFGSASDFFWALAFCAAALVAAIGAILHALAKNHSRAI